MRWSDPDPADPRSLAFTLAPVGSNESALHIVLNMADESIRRPLPKIGGTHWHVAVDTVAPTPGDIVTPPDQRPLRDGPFEVRGRSVVVLEAR